MFESNLPLKVSSFILALTYAICLVLFTADTLVFTVLCVICLSAAIVLSYILTKLSKL